MKNFIKNNWILLLIILYVISPIDLIPDILAPVIGPVVYADDILLLLLEIIKKVRESKKNSQNKDIVEGEIVK